MNDAGSMGLLGLTAMEERVYRHFLRNPGTTAEDIHLLLHASQDIVGAALRRLTELGLLRRAEATAEGGARTAADPAAAGSETGGTLTAADPEVAVGLLTDRRLSELHHELQQVTRPRHLVAELRAEQGAHTQAGGGVERMTNLAQIRDRIDDLAFFAREEILSVEPYRALTRENIAHARPLDSRCLRRGVHIRSVVLKDALDDPATAAYLRELNAQGARIRVAADIAERVLVYDRHTALVPADPSDTSRGALVAQEPGLVASILALFEKIWDQATDLTDLLGAPAPESESLTPMELEVLKSMCRVTKDEIGARELGVSLRTYRRHVADVLRTLNASNRPHAALLARERGWI
ncbi:helix-turn-helix transcriptional regulator [Streptomyces sp. JV178]|uniref:helix-turn-helix transcriptional regulator n=1 Tax=Streptomyces sp. JV178 TaxID=858632 RepID=UPI000C1B1DAF|nr:helix-turn-helix transcriptional regulator [Streptomyces sp. JV178]PIM70868.1 helix-turn-helix transcriptional regulator [Streptomyces sp. JV178]